MDEQNDNFAQAPDTYAVTIVEDKANSETVINPENPPADNSAVTEPGVTGGKFEGKSISEIAQSYEELERKFGQQGEELGNLRRSFDEGVLSLLKQQQPTNIQKNTEPGITDDLLAEKILEDPKSAIAEIERRVEKRVMKRVDSVTLKSKAENILLQNHPDAREILNGQDFASWAKKNLPEELAVMSDERELRGDPSILNYIIGNYKQNQNNKNNNAGNIVSPAKMAAPVPGMSSNLSGTKIITREELAKLTPEQYAERNDEIVRAYREGRVK